MICPSLKSDSRIVIMVATESVRSGFMKVGKI